MKLTIIPYGQLGRLAPPRAPEGDYPEGAPLCEVLELFLAGCDPAAREIVFTAERRLRPSLIVLVNGLPVAKENPGPLKDGDQITLLTAIAGG